MRALDRDDVFLAVEVEVAVVVEAAVVASWLYKKSD